MKTEADVERLNAVERAGLAFLRRGARRGDSEIRAWRDEDRARIRRLQLWAVGLCALSGAVSASLIGAADLWLRDALVTGAEPSLLALGSDAAYWAWYGGIAVVVSLLELLAMYWVLLRSVAGIADAAGLAVSRRDVEDALATGLSRAALDIPNPRRALHGLDPYARTSRLKMLAYAALYRVKVGANSFVVRILARRVLARSGLRVLLPFAAVPVFAGWNALIAWWVIREARVRAAGPLAVREAVAALERARLDDDGRRLALDAVAELVVAAEDAHPNYDLLLARLRDALGIEPRIPEWRQVRARLAATDTRVQHAVLALMTTTTALRGRSRRRQGRVLETLTRRATCRPETHWLRRNGALRKAAANPADACAGAMRRAGIRGSGAPAFFRTQHDTRVRSGRGGVSSHDPAADHPAPMEWQTNPLLREEIGVVRRPLRSIPLLYEWRACAGVMMLMWKGKAVGAVYPGGQYWLKWRRREYAGTAASPAQARRFMTRWVGARRQVAPLLDEDLPPKALVPLETFLREYDAQYA